MKKLKATVLCVACSGAIASADQRFFHAGRVVCKPCLAKAREADQIEAFRRDEERAEAKKRLAAEKTAAVKAKIEAELEKRWKDGPRDGQPKVVTT